MSFSNRVREYSSAYLRRTYREAGRPYRSFQGEHRLANPEKQQVRPDITYRIGRNPGSNG